ncbi:hypothetical protein C8Q80DRAFT_1121255 [Daedaleopsis nitida]|nr:hypothetical protein C8Q80DRAFT_1121255 [Daedaleopsis nitida]
MPENPRDEQSQSLKVALQSQQSDTVALNVDQVLPVQLEKISTTFETGACDIDIEASYVKYWSGVTPSVQRFPNVNYKKFRAQVGPALGHTPAMVPDDTAIHNSLREWAWAMSEQQWDSPALQETWDLDDHNPQRISLLLRHLTRILKRISTDCHTPVLFELSFCNDPEDQLWKLLVGPMVRDFIKKPHARAGLTLEGIIWCLLLDCLGEEDYIASFFRNASSNGPSSEYSVYGEVAVRTEDCKFVDDVLSAEKLGMIVGIYKMFTKQSNQTETRSWWPQHDHWKTHPVYQDKWSLWHEKWFRDHREKILNGSAHSLTASQWADTLNRFK